MNTIIFDLGGVVINLERSRAVDRLSALGIPDVDSLLGLYRQEGPFLDIECGRCTAAEFYDRLRPLCLPGTTDRDIQDAFNAFLISLPVERLQTLRRLRKEGWKVLCISNTNPVMYNSWIAEAFRGEGLTVNDYFDGIVASFEEGCCKPDPEIFMHLIRRYNVVPSEAVLLDDSRANCEAAEKCGLNAICIGTPEAPDMIKATATLTFTGK